jgi:hypothetical protein
LQHAVLPDRNDVAASYAGRCRARPDPASVRSRQSDRPALAVLLAAGVALGGCAAATEAAGPPTVQATAITLGDHPLNEAMLGPLRFEAGFALHSTDPRFGGLSGLWLAPDGGRMLAVSDHGTLWSVELESDANGRLTGFAGWQAIEPGAAPGDPPGRDAEALASSGPDGLVIAYEGVHRLRRLGLADPTAPATALPTPQGLGPPSDTGIEALAELEDGALLALSEGAFTSKGDLAGWRIEGGRTQPLTYAVSLGFVPTGADRLGDTIYVVERSFSLLSGFQSRIVTLPAAAVRPGARLIGEVLAELHPPLVGENFEGIAVRRGGDGRVLLYLVSDDNFFALQRTLLLQFSLPGSGPLAQRAGAARASN